MQHLLAFTRQLRRAYIEDAAAAAEGRDQPELLAAIRDIMRLETIAKQLESWINETQQGENA